MKFSQMEYKRPEYEEAKEKYEELLRGFRSAKTAEESFAAYKEIEEYDKELTTMATIAFIRNSLDTTDEYYDKEQAYFDEIIPKLQPIQQEIKIAMLGSEYRKEMEEAWGKLLFLNTEIALKTFKPEIVAELQEENRLVTEYDKLIASAQIEYDGKQLTLAQLTPYHQSSERKVREESLRARAVWYMSHGERLDSLYDELVQLRTGIARKLGYANYIELGYYRMQRNCYDEEKVRKFRKGVREHLVPVSNAIKREQAARIGVERITLYDDPFEYPDGNAVPKGSAEEIFAHGRKMYHELSKETGEFIDFMIENELFDVLTRAGKSGGGYCATIPNYKSPFIFANFNGTSGDIDVLTHEAGHAFAAYIARDIYPSELAECTYETAEVHSMSMEFFTWPWMEGFFGDATEKYKQSHLSSALTFIPYGTMVDEFQHRVYENPEMRAGERNALWKELEGTYRPYLEMGDFPFYSEGRRWQAQSHIYQRPFYYIDYCLAQTMALLFWTEDQKSHKSAWEKYRRFIGYAGTKTFTELIEEVGLRSPFEIETLKEVGTAAMEWLKNRPNLLK